MADELGVGSEVIKLMQSTPEDRVRLLQPSELSTTRLVTDFRTGEELVTGVAPRGMGRVGAI